MKLKKMLNILSLSIWDYAGCGFFLSQAINETTEHKSRAVASRRSRLRFPTDIITRDEGAIRDLWKRADVIHIHDGADIPKDAPPRPIVVTWHGTIYRQRIEYWNEKAVRAGWLATAATLDLTLHGPRWLPDCRPDVSSHTKKTPGRFKVCQAPTRRIGKSTDTVLEAVKDLNFDLIERVSWKDCLKRKGKCDVLIDQFKECYGCNAIEAWLMDIPVIANARDEQVIQLIERHAPDGFPFIRCSDNPEAVRAALKRLRGDKAYYDKYVKRGRLYVERNHSYATVAAMAVNFYHEALERFMDRPAGVELVQHPGPHGMLPPVKKGITPEPPQPSQQVDAGLILLRYVGRNDLTVTFFGERTKRRYQFGRKAKPLGYVFAADVPGLLAEREGKRRAFVKEKEK